MSLPALLPMSEMLTLLEVVQQSFSIRRHYELFRWLQEDLQEFLPHDILIAAWGDFSLGLISYDIVSPLPGIRTEAFDEASVAPFVTGLFLRWLESNRSPFVLNADNGFSHAGVSCSKIDDAMQRMRCCNVHGIKDQRGRHDCLYVLMGPRELDTPRAKQALRFLLPYIDASFRQIAHLPAQYSGDAADDPDFAIEEEPIVELPASLPNPFGLSDRELEIMSWVRQGKTNQEIGMILDISAFTVKNHLQRIFRKIDVLNRAQAVAKMEGTLGHVA